MGFNINQQLAIDTRNADILVSAPAGSGKTAVLVERIMSLILEGKNVDELLVLTFTEAAGNEMKQRLLKKLNDLIDSNTLDQKTLNYLKLQKLKLPNAYITNFHGFCSTLLKKYGYMIHIMPGFNILSDSASLKKETLETLETTWFNDPVFCDFLRLYFPGNNLCQFEETLLSIEALSHSICGFDQYVKDIHHNYYLTLEDGLGKWPMFEVLKELLNKEVQHSKDALAQLYSFAQSYGINAFYEYDDIQIEKGETKPSPYDALYCYIDTISDGLKYARTYNSIVSLLNTTIEKSYTIAWKKLGIDEDIKKQFNKLKTEVTAPIKKITSEYFSEPEQQIIDKIKGGYYPLNMIFKLLKDFKEAYGLAKLEHNYLDFNDLEYYCDLLLSNEEVMFKITNKISEVMIDEYQDTNQIQEDLITKIVTSNPTKEIHTFMVGDMKQSIYRFRQADPEIFYNKYITFSRDDKESQKTHTRRIDLGYNYRSSKIILDSINYIFNAIMDTSIGGLEYYNDDSAKLNFDFVGRNIDLKDFETEFQNKKELSTELLINLKDEHSSYSTAEEEAHMIAQRIIKLKTSGLDSKEITFSDIAVLMKNANEFITFKKVFDSYNIPNHIVLSKGLIESIEYRDLTHMLKAFVHFSTKTRDGKYVDDVDAIAFMNLLSRPYAFSNFSFEEIAKLHLLDQNISLYQSCRLSDDEKIRSFMKVYDQLYELSLKNPYDFLLKLEELSNYNLFVSQLINSEQRLSNIHLFNEIVKGAMVDHPYLDDLVNYLESISDQAPAPIASSNNDRVKFMTIHKSKGLEFKVVFVSQTQHKFNMQDVSGKIIIDKKYGYATAARNIKHGHVVEYNNPYKKLIGTKIKEETINEEMRVLYVALTRAVDKLILTGSVKSIDEITNIQSKLIYNASSDIEHKDKNKIILNDQMRNTNNYLTWLLEACLRHPNVIEDCKQYDELKHNANKLQFLYKHVEDDNTKHALFSFKLIDTSSIINNFNILDKQKHHADSNVMKYIDFVYPFNVDKKEVNSVTQLVEHVDDHYNYLDHDSDDLVMSATDRGTLVHLLLSELNFDKKDKAVLAIEKLLDDNLCDVITKNELLKYKDHIQAFIDSDIYNDVCNADYIYKEKPFSCFDKQLNQVVHGIFDLVYIKDNTCFVLDYKTDRFVDNIDDQTLIEAHKPQLTYYKHILEDMYQLNTKCITYYLHLDKKVVF